MLILLWLLFGSNINKLNSPDFDIRSQHLQTVKESWKRWPVGVICMFNVKQDAELCNYADKLLQTKWPKECITDPYTHISAVIWMCKARMWYNTDETFWLYPDRALVLTRVSYMIGIKRNDIVASWETSTPPNDWFHYAYIYGLIECCNWKVKVILYSSWLNNLNIPSV